MSPAVVEHPGLVTETYEEVPMTEHRNEVDQVALADLIAAVRHEAAQAEADFRAALQRVSEAADALEALHTFTEQADR